MISCARDLLLWFSLVLLASVLAIGATGPVKGHGKDPKGADARAGVATVRSIKELLMAGRRGFLKTVALAAGSATQG